jgi:hypothetical protein
MINEVNYPGSLKFMIPDLQNISKFIRIIQFEPNKSQT